MAFGKRYIRARIRDEKKYGGSRYTKAYGRKKSRRSVAKTRYRKRRGVMSKKSILNISSRKKRDNMAYYTNVTLADRGSTVYANVPALLAGGSADPYSFLWCATARDNTINSGRTAGNIFDQATRTATTCFMRGLSEKIELQVTDGLPWQWRRVCFTAKGLQTQLTVGGTFGLAIENSNGFQRVVNQVTGTNRDAIESVLFKGQKNVDWFDEVVAPLDNSRVTIKYDKTITIASGNEDGCIRKYNRWMPMNHNLVYDDDEDGGGEAADQYSVQGKAGMGDYFILDYFRPRDGSSSDNHLSFSPQATLYWHEK